jgi:hypothetical protein
MVAGKTAPRVAEAAAPVEGAEQVAYDKPFVDALGDATTQAKLAKQGIQFQPTRSFMQNDLGLSNDPNEWRANANFITDQLTKQVDNAASNQPDILKQDIVPQLHNLVQQHGASSVEPEATDTLGKFLSLGLGKAQKTASDGAETYSAEGLQKLIRDVGDRYAKNPLTMNPLAQTTGAKMTEHEALPEVQQFLKDLVHNRSGVNQAIASDSTVGDDAQKIMDAAPSAQAGKYVVDTLNNSQTAAEINAAMRPAVHADKIAKEVLAFQKGVKPSIQQAKDVTAAQAEADKMAAQEAGKPHPAEKMTSDVVGGLMGGVPAKISVAAKLAGGFVPALNKLAQGGSDLLGKMDLGKAGALTGAGIGSLGNLGNANQNPSGTLGGDMQPASAMAGGLGGGGAMGGGPTLADNTALTNPNILSQLDRMLAADPFLASSLTGPIQQLAAPVTAAQAAQQMLPGYENTLSAAGAGQGPIAGLLARIGGLITGGPANQVAPQQQALQALLTRAGAPGLSVPGLYANQAGLGAGLAPTSSVLGALGGQ